jgi:3-phosphoshikimate 1-carboxyvinyltransferase
MRLACGILAGLKGDFILDGDAMLRRRPMARVTEPLKQMGARISGELAPLRITGGPLRGVDYCSPLASAQVKSAVLLAGLNAKGATTYSEPMPSRNHTELLLRACGADLSLSERRCRLIPGEINLPATFTVPGDASGAAFFLTAAAFIPGSDVIARNMSLNPGRIAFLEVLRRMGAGVEITCQEAELEPWGQARVFYNGPLRAVQVTEIPSLVDEVPILALAAAHARGLSVFHEVGELAVKEVNRLLALQQQLGALGAEIALKGGDLIINGRPALDKARAAVAPLDSWGDHRMAMTLTMALKALDMPLPVKGAESVSVSYPDFFQDLARLWL